MIPFRFVKTASVENDTGRPDPTYPDEGFNTSKDEGYGSIPVAAGAAKVPGLSVHCLGCGCELKGKPKRCAKCGQDTRRVARAEKRANVTTAGGPIDAPGSQNMPGSGYQSPTPVNAGAANVPGMSVHCLKCGKKISNGEPSCPKCGNDVRRVATNMNQEATPPARDDESGDTAADTGGEATVDQDRTRGAYVGLGKYAKVGQMPGLGREFFGGAAFAVTPMAAYGMHKTLREAQKEEDFIKTQELVAAGKLPESELLKFQHFLDIEKLARSGANPILNLRRARKSLTQASGKFRVSMLHGGRKR
ncbi:zinc ribbon domain-containing protein [bacterium]|nr:zinc ribbon domain-containing protein [bacterium]